MELAHALADQGHRVDVMQRREDEDSPDVSAPRAGLRVLRLSAGPAVPLNEAHTLRHVPALVSAVEKLIAYGGRYDVAHAHRLLSGLVAQRVKESKGLPFAASFDSLGLVIRSEHIEYEESVERRVDIERRVMSHADCVLAECPRQRDDLQRLYGVHVDQIAVSPPGVDTSIFQPGNRALARRKAGLAADDFVIVQAGKLTAHKGVDNAMRAMGRLGSSMRARLLVVGADADANGAEIRRLAELAKDCGVASQVEFLGPRPRSEMPELLAAADVLVDTPWFEPLSKLPLEAMACGIPVIVSDVGGASHTVSDGVTGFLVRPRDPFGLAGRLEQLQSNPALAGAFGRAGVLRARSVFGWDHVAHELSHIYHRLRDQAVSNGSWVLAMPEDGFRWSAMADASSIAAAEHTADTGIETVNGIGWYQAYDKASRPHADTRLHRT